MGYLEFFSSLIDSLVWPGAMLAFILVFKKPLSKILLTLTRVKYKDLQIDFEKELAQLESMEKESRFALKPDQPDNTLRVKPEGPAVVRSLEDEIQLIAGISPRVAIPLAWSAVESELMSAVMRFKVSPDYPPYNSGLRNAQYLRDAELINPNTVSIVEKLRRLRNKVLHNTELSTAITTEQAMEYSKLAQNVIGELISIGVKKVFMSYEFQDKHYKNLIVAGDTERHYEFFLLEKDITAATDTQSIRMKIAEAIKHSTVFLCIIGENTHKNPWVIWEAEKAVEQNKPIIIVKIKPENEVPSVLENFEAISFDFDSIKKSLDEA